MKEATPAGIRDPLKRRRALAALFDRIARVYDTFNDLLSFGLHRVARRALVAEVFAEAKGCVVDICAGTGELSRRALRHVDGPIVLVDASPGMLRVARHRLGPNGLIVVGDAQRLPLRSGVADVALMGFGLRSMADPARAFCEAARILRPGGLLGVVEFTQPEGWLRRLILAYVATVVPAVGRLACRAAYQFLADTVVNVPPLEVYLGQMRAAGFEVISVRRFAFGAMFTAVARLSHSRREAPGC